MRTYFQFKGQLVFWVILCLLVSLPLLFLAALSLAGVFFSWPSPPRTYTYPLRFHFTTGVLDSAGCKAAYVELRRAASNSSFQSSFTCFTVASAGNIQRSFLCGSSSTLRNFRRFSPNSWLMVPFFLTVQRGQ